VFSHRIADWTTSTSKETTLTLDAIDRALHQRPLQYHRDEEESKHVHHSDAGGQHPSFRFTPHLLESCINASIGTAGDALDNALTESVIGLYKTPVDETCGPWHTIQEVDVATTTYAD
jgi:putative transposase